MKRRRIKMTTVSSLLKICAEGEGLSVVSHELRSSCLDVVLFNRDLDSYERFAIIAKEVDGKGVLVAMDVAVSVFPNPAIPAGPFGWYGDLRDVIIHGSIKGVDVYGANFIRLANRESVEQAVDFNWINLFKAAISLLNKQAGFIHSKEVVSVFKDKYKCINKKQYDSECFGRDEMLACREVMGDLWKWVEYGCGLGFEQTCVNGVRQTGSAKQCEC